MIACESRLVGPAERRSPSLSPSESEARLAAVEPVGTAGAGAAALAGSADGELTGRLALRKVKDSEAMDMRVS
jgi:hypothetical protein